VSLADLGETATIHIDRAQDANRQLALKSLAQYLALTVVGLAGILACGHRRSESRAVEQGQSSEQVRVSLRAETRQVKSRLIIQLRWDPTAAPMRRSSRGILYIYDGFVPKQRLLDRRALAFGSTEYAPESDEVSFHLMLDRDTPEGESLLVLLGAPQATHVGLESDADAANRAR